MTMRRVLPTALAALLAGAGLCLWLVREHLQERTALLQPGPLPVRTQGMGDVLLLGDSRVAQWPLPEGWAKAGYAGHTLVRIAEVAPGVLDSTRPRVMVVQAGINDLVAICYLPAERQDPAQARSLLALRSLVDAALARGTRVVLAEVVPPIGLDPLRAFMTRNCLDKRIMMFNRAARGLQGNGVRVIDAAAALRDGQDWAPGMAADSLHWTPAAYARLTAALSPVIAKARG